MGGGKGGVGSSTPGVQMAGGRGDGGGNAAGERGGTEMNNSETSNNESNNEMGNNIEMSNNETNTSSSMDSNVSLLSRDAGAVPGEDDLPFQVTIEHIQGDPRNPLELRRRVQVEVCWCGKGCGGGCCCIVVNAAVVVFMLFSCTLTVHLPCMK